MEVSFLKKFSKDIDNITSPKDKQILSNLIEQVKKANSLADIPNLKKLKGFDDAYRIRMGNYRIGVFVSQNQILFARIVHRKDIYRLFP